MYAHVRTPKRDAYFGRFPVIYVDRSTNPSKSYILYSPLLSFPILTSIMVSFKAQFIHWYIYFWQFLANRASIKQLQNNVQQTFKAESSPAVLPDAITSNTGISITKEIFKSEQEWEVFHVKPKHGEGRKKVVVYWHGGAFIRGVSESRQTKARTSLTR